MMEDTEQKCRNVPSENGILWADKFLVCLSTVTTETGKDTGVQAAC